MHGGGGGYYEREVVPEPDPSGSGIHWKVITIAMDTYTTSNYKQSA